MANQERINAGNNFINMELKIRRLEAEIKRKEFKIRELKKAQQEYLKAENMDKKEFTKHIQSAFSHIDLSSEGEMKKFMESFIPLMKLKLEGKIKNNKDGSASFDKRELNKNKEKTNDN